MADKPKDYKEIAIAFAKSYHGVLCEQFSTASDRAYHGGGADADNEADRLQDAIQSVEEFLTSEGAEFDSLAQKIIDEDTDDDTTDADEDD